MSAYRPIHLLLLALSVAAVAWGALAFGAVYSWAYTPLALACGGVGLAALLLERTGPPRLRALAWSLAAIAIAVGLQLIPLPLAVLTRVSPATDAFLTRYDFSYQVARQSASYTEAEAPQPPPRQPVSIAPDKTVVGALLFGALAVFLLGLARLLSRVGAKRLVMWVIAIGCLLAMIGIAEHGTLSNPYPLIYGFWKPRNPALTFGPFVNPNHFAGWMLMALPLAFGAFFEALARTIEAVPPRGANRISVLASREAMAAVVLAAACLLMALSLLMTRSRSGMLAFGIGAVIAAAVVVRRQPGARARATLVGAVLALLIATFSWAGVDTLTSKFTEAQAGKSFTGRLAAWKDTVHIIRDFPITGSGLDTYGTAMMVYQSTNRGLHFQEAHNDYLQLAAEGGLLVGIPALIALGVFVRDVRERFREAPTYGTTYYLRVGAVVGLISIAMQSLVEFSLQMPGNAVLCALLAAIALHRSPNLRRGALVRS